MTAIVRIPKIPHAPDQPNWSLIHFKPRGAKENEKAVTTPLKANAFPLLLSNHLPIALRPVIVRTP